MVHFDYKVITYTKLFLDTVNMTGILIGHLHFPYVTEDYTLKCCGKSWNVLVIPYVYVAIKPILTLAQLYRYNVIMQDQKGDGTILFTASMVYFRESMCIE